MKKGLWIWLVTGACVSCNNDHKNIDAVPAVIKDTPAAAKTAVVNEKSREDKVLDSISKLPFIITAGRQIDSATHHQHGIAFLVDSSEKEWMVQAGYNGPERFETYQRLYVNPLTLEIKVYDVVNDTKINVADYLKNDH